jgi:hypothetical protein
MPSQEATVAMSDNAGILQLSPKQSRKNPGSKPPPVPPRALEQHSKEEAKRAEESGEGESEEQRRKRHREEAVKEIIATEQQYVQDLELTVRVPLPVSLSLSHFASFVSLLPFPPPPSVATGIVTETLNGQYSV